MTISQDPRHTRIYLKDYTPPEFLIEEVALEFDLDPVSTVVTSRLSIRRNPKAQTSTGILKLDGIDLETLEVQLNEHVLSKEQYQETSELLSVKIPGDSATLQTKVRTHPEKNTVLFGLYISSQILATQCEAEGFRRITWYQDRPDVMARFQVTMRADKSKFPVLLSNGNPKSSRELGDGRHEAVWHDPFAKPAYLFALIAGDLENLEDHFTTKSGRDITLRAYASAEQISKCSFALSSLKKAMKWDEETFGLEYDLDLFNIVAINDFNYGAMENKGLNIFNSRAILADQNSANDQRFHQIDATVAHEYFHNFTGNRVTLRDWFQLSLKEGLTVLREQLYMADQYSPAIERVAQVATLRTAQFAEDASPAAHPVRPSSYITIDNFYTMTIYEKGAELLRMMSIVLGRESFLKAVKHYLQKHDGTGATCEDFVAALEESSGKDLSQFHHWYRQSGTPKVTVEEDWDEARRILHLTLSQNTEPTCDQKEKHTLPIPVVMALLANDGTEAELHSKGLASGEKSCSFVLSEERRKLTFENFKSRPVSSLFRGFSAPVHIQHPQKTKDLCFRLANDQDPFNRWDASQKLFENLFDELVAQQSRNEKMSIPEPLFEAWQKILADQKLDYFARAQALTPPPLQSLAVSRNNIDPSRWIAAADFINESMAQRFQNELLATWETLSSNKEPFIFDGPSMGKRMLKNRCLALLGYTGSSKTAIMANAQYKNADNMTDRLAALAILVSNRLEGHQDALDDFFKQWRHDPMILCDWFMVIATARKGDTLQDLERILKHPDFRITTPSHVRSSIGVFASSNWHHFHSVPERSYKLLRDYIVQLDALNPKTSAALAGTMKLWRHWEPKRQALAQQMLESIRAESKLSADLAETVGDLLATV